MDNSKIQKILIMDDSLTRIDKWLAIQLPEFSRSQIVNAIKDGTIYLQNNKKMKSNIVLNSGTEIFVSLVTEKNEDSQPEPQDIALDIIFEDQDMIVLNKPINLAIHPGAGNPDNTLVNRLVKHFGNSLSDLAGKDRPGIVHRLDKDTSGLLIVAKNNQFHQEISRLFKERKITRIYKALVWNKPDSARGTIDAPIGRDPFNRLKMAIVPNGKSAITHFKLLKVFTPTPKYSTASELELELYTGRTHQIRVHLAYIGLPIIGDPVYNLKRDNLKLPAQALYAAQLSFIHPKSGKEYKFELEPPDYYNNTKNILELNDKK